MSEYLDIVNVLAFLNSLPDEFGESRKKNVASSDLSGEHIVTLEMERRINHKWYAGKFIFRVDDQSVLRMILGIGTSHKLDRLEGLKQKVATHTIEKPPLGQIIVDRDGPRVVLFTHYGLRIYDEWFTDDFRRPCQNLIINTMEFMFWDLINTIKTLGRP